ncbi:hypothetical protein [Exiguobacterium sp. SRB7LM]|uniref:hypothetical protein n=1 Tax=Exiguobacterium sp. SRB7LM TaxID=2608401 RepID=UPI0018C375CE|nr:hypothetical protein [Exiguobacterium sp. SRB7LM]MBG0916236.1 hypothetical protein [Exiguobacterium sp. SRB7LM]
MATHIRVTDQRYNGKAKPGPKPKTTLSVAQHQAIQYMTLGDSNGRPMTDIQIAEACGVHRNTVRAWRRQTLFEDAYKQAVIAVSADRLPEMLEAMADAVINDGNAAAAKLLLQVNGLIGSKIAVVTTNREEIRLTPEDIKIRLAVIDAANTFASNRSKGLRKMERLLAV